MCTADAPTTVTATDAGQSELPLAISDAIAELHQHPAVESVEVHGRVAGGTHVVATFRVDLPSRWEAEGQSATGVRPREPVHFVYPADYPAHAPRIGLRQDFNRRLPHINPHVEGDYVPPCIVFGGIHEFLYGHGMSGIADQTAAWLRNAADNTLIDPHQGWEPVRRDVATDEAAFDPVALERLITPDGGSTRLRAAFFSSVSEDDHPDAVAFVISESETRLYARDVPTLFDARARDGVMVGTTLAIICWPDKRPDGTSFVADSYQPDTVATYGHLLAYADEINCGQALRSQLNWIARCAAADGNQRKFVYPLIVVMCARRPVPVIGTASCIEFIAYRIDARFPGFLSDGVQTPVSPVALLLKPTLPLFRRLSGVPIDVLTGQTTLLGCGSLGSKIALHLGRAGLAPAVVVDSECMSPHNLARHALLPSGDLFEPILMVSKARGLATILRGLGGKTAGIDVDVRTLRAAESTFNAVFPQGTDLVINATAAHAVRSHLSYSAGLKHRIAEVGIFAQGLAGFLGLEGPARNPDSSDLAALAYEELRADPSTCALLDATSRTGRRVAIGIGCDSATIVMSDARLSMYAAAQSAQIIDWITNGMPEDGRLLIGMLTDTFSLTWRQLAVGPTHVLGAENEEGWSIRILDRAHNKIMSDIARHPSVETGGILVGRLSSVERIIHVVDVLAAPSNSRRSRHAFVLGTRRARERLDAYENSAAGALRCLGTWHSHLTDQGGSRTDYGTAAIFRRLSELVSLMLIRRPSGYNGIVIRGGTTRIGASIGWVG